MLIVKPIENPDVIICQRHNENILLFSLDKQTNIWDQLFCLQCIREKTVIPQSVSWDDIKTMIQDKQERRQRQFISTLKLITQNIDIFKGLISSIRTTLIQKLDSMIAITESWIKDITSQINYQYDYSLFEELKLMTQQQQQQFNESDKKQNLQVKKSNEKFLSLLIDESRQLYTQSNYSKLQEVILEITTLLKENYFQGCEEQAITQQGKTQNVLVRCLCPKHSLQITHISLDKSIIKNKRTFCVECEQENTIPLEMFLQKWENYEQQIQIVKKQRIQELQKEVIQRKNYITSIKTNLIKEFNYTNQLFDKFMQNEIEMSNTPQMVLNNNTKLDEIQEMADILSKQGQENQQDANIQQRTVTLHQKVNNHLTIMVSNFMKMTEEHKLKNSFKQNLDDNTMQLVVQQKFNTKQKGNCYAMAFNHQENIMIAGCNEQIKIFEFNQGILKQGKETLLGHGDHVLCLVYSKLHEWFVSGGKDSAIICWKQTEGKKWISSESYKNHNKMITCLIMTNQEDQLISSSADSTIIVWKIHYKKNELTYYYTLDKHQGTVYCLSLNKSQTLMVSSSFDKKIILWSKHQLFEKWELNQYINQSVLDFGCRITFIDDDLIAWQQHSDGQLYFFKQEEGKFIEKEDYTIQLNQSLQDEYLFPSIYHDQKGILINRYKQFVYILKKQIDGKFKLASKPIDCISSQNFGTLSPSGQFLVLWNKGNFILSVHTFKY